jgi:phosphomannomutase
MDINREFFMSSLSDIFKAYDIRGKVGEELSASFVYTIGQTFAEWLPVEGIVAVGHDMRPDSEELANAFIDGLVSQGRAVWDLGLVTSDMIYFAIGKWDLAGGAVITASHNPGADNGIKLYRDKVTPVGLDSGLSQIRDRALEGKEFAIKNAGSSSSRNITKEWVEHCLTFIDTLKPFNIAIDAGNGMAGAVLPEILPYLPINAQQMYFELDGTFPNHEANPQKPENLNDLAETVVKNNLDFGIAFDGDGDRAGFVDDKGRPVLGTDLLTMVSKLYIDKNAGSGEIIHDVRTSRATQEFIRKWGGIPYRTKAGRVNIGAVMRKRGAIFGGETTGHLFFKENYDADSGLIAALTAMQALSNTNMKLSELIDSYRTYHMGPEINFKTEKDKAWVFETLQTAYYEGESDMLDGLTIRYPDFWFNLRASNTEPLMRLNAEANTEEALQEVIRKVTEIIEK